MNKYVAVIQYVNMDLAPKFHGLVASVYSQVPADAWENELGRAIAWEEWVEGKTYADCFAAIRQEFPGIPVVVFDRYDRDNDMAAALKAAFEGALDVKAHNAFRHVKDF